MSRILVINPFPLDEEGVARRAAQGQHVELDPSTELVYRPVRVGSTSFMSHHDWLLADIGIYEAAVDAEKEGFDAVVIDTMSDSGMAALRSVLSIPVIGPGKASMLYALTLGNSFSVLAQWKPALPRYKKVIREYGLERQCASVRSFDIEPDFVNLTEGKEDTVFPRMLETAMRCVEEDGAEVICLGSTTMHLAAKYLAEHLPVPLINPGPFSYKLAETLLSLKLTHSRHAYPSPQVRKDELVHALVDAAV
ncbi:aspartate/glutamate racemase family protein [Paenalcaligenes suwonensis]|uniref:aspartate/glutamate racemase family protein n=1 Tax=Paenalcaligenes suwonensis TaxID=1202713 RepID=UPI001408D711|nr:aspartate/glutamate racemase family protein [Paenalcaligenes suwonensis]NHC62311.1 hydrogenase expression protein HupH [Paenalcaligenes suwonensis]